MTQSTRPFWLWFGLFLIILNLVILGCSSTRSTKRIWDAVPSDTSLAVRFQLATLLPKDTIPDFYLKAQFYKDLAPLSTLLGEEEQKQPILAVLQSNTPELFNWLFITTNSENEDLLNSIPNQNFRRSILEGVQVFESKEFTIAFHKGLLLLAPHRFQVERAIKQLNQPNTSWLKNRRFQKLLQEEDTRFTLYAYPANSPILLSSFLSPDGVRQLSQFSQLEEWWLWKLNQVKNGWNLVGQSTDETNEQNNAPILNILPNNIAYFNACAADNVDLPFEIAPLKEDLAITGYFDLYNDKIERYKFTVYHTKRDLLIPIRSALNQGQLKASLYQMFEIYKNDAGQYFTVLEGCLIICYDLKQLEIWLDQYVSGAMLSKESIFLNRDSTQTTSFFVKSQQLSPLLKQLLKPNYQANTLKEWQNNPPFSVALNQKGTSWQGNISMQPTTSIDANIVWKAPLLEEAIVPPTVLKTRNNQTFIFIQDAAKRLYCLDKFGNERWRRELEATLISSVQLVEGNQTQFIFNTAYKVYLIDETGSDQSTYPITLQSPASVGLTLIDFNGTGDYHYLFGCENGKVYGFNLGGYPMTEWNPKEGIGKLQQPILHFQQDNQDFLALLSDTLFVFGRYGDLKFPVYSHPNLNEATLDYQLSRRSNRIVVADSKGLTHIIGLNGTAFRLRTSQATDSPVKFAFADVCEDDRKDYITLSGTQLETYAYDSTDQFKLETNYQFAVPQDTVFAIPPYIGTVSKSTDKIYLFQSGELVKGFPLAGTLPFTITSLGTQNEKILITAYDNTVYAYRINSTANQ